MNTRTVQLSTLVLTALSGCHHVSRGTTSFALSGGRRSPSRSGPPGHARKGEC